MMSNFKTDYLGQPLETGHTVVFCHSQDKIIRVGVIRYFTSERIYLYELINQSNDEVRREKTYVRRRVPRIRRRFVRVQFDSKTLPDYFQEAIHRTFQLMREEGLL